MKYLKLLVLAVAAASWLAITGPGTASAETVLCTEKAALCPATKADGVGTEIKMSLVSGTKSKITTGSVFESAIPLECGKSSLTAKVTGVEKDLTASVEGLTFEECTCEVKVLKKGTLTLEHIASTDNATVRSIGTEVTVNCTPMFASIHCIYVTEATDLGTLNGGNPAKIKISEVVISRLATNPLCAEKANWDAEYEVTSPKPLYVESEAASKETVLCTEKATPCPGGKADGTETEIKTSLVSGVKSKLTTPYNNIECGKSTINATVTSEGEHLGASVETMTFEECNCEVKVLTKGTLDLQRINGTENATVKSTGTEITTQCSTIFGTVHCIYKTTATDLGTLEGGNPAKIKISEAEIPRLSTNTHCAEGANWDAEYEVTSPKPLYVEPEAGPAETETILCTESAAPCPAGKADGTGTEIKMGLVSGVKSRLTTEFITIECSASTINAKVTSTGEQVVASVESLTFSSCNCEVKVIKNGALELKYLNGTANSTVKSTGTEVTTTCSTIFGTVHCIYVTSSTDFGTLKGGNPAKVAIAGANSPRSTTNPLCAAKANWDAEYEVTSPKPLFFEPE